MPHTSKRGCPRDSMPKRRWDARIVVKGQKPYPTTRGVAHLVESISTLIHGSKEDNFEEIDMRFRNSKDLKVMNVFAKRRLSHRCKKNDRITLSVTEVAQINAFGLTSRFVQNMHDRALWGVRPCERGWLIGEQGLWFEADLKIASHPAMEQNMALHFGDDAEWESKEVMGEELLHDIQAVVDQLVTRLDGVGLTNRGLRGSAEDLEEIAAERAQIAADREQEKRRAMGLW